MLYKVYVTETHQRIVAVDADSPSAAYQRVSDAWHNSELTLNDNDFEGLEVYVAGEATEDDHLFKVERKD